MSVADEQDVEVPEAEPLPAEEPRHTPEDGSRTREETPGEQPESSEGPPPLPPLLETGASSLATTGAGIYTAAGPAGLAAAAGIAGIAGAAYGVRHLNNRRRDAAAAGRGGAGARSGLGARSARQGLLGALSGRSGAGGARAGRFGAGGRGAGRGGAGARSGGLARRARQGAGGGAGAGGLLGRGGGRSGSAGAGGGLLGSGAGGGGHRRSGGGAGAGGLFGRGAGSGAGARSGRSGGGLLGGSSAGRRGTGRSGAGGGLFGGAGSGRGARRARTGRGRGSLTAITDPAVPIGSGRGRARRLARAGWNHPRTKRARAATRRGAVRTRRGLSRGRVRMNDYLRRRRWALRLRGWGRSARDWWSRMWDRLRGRASDPRYGPLRGWQLTAAAAAIGAIGAGKKKSQPRVLTGRIIGTAAPVPGDAGPIALAGRGLLALTTGDEGETLAPEAQRVRDAADELKQALAALGGSQVGMLTYEQGLKELGGAFGTVADGVRSMSQTAEDEQPLASEVLEFLGTIEDSQRGAAQVAEEMPGLFRAAHEVELGRLENPRRGEHKWDVSQQ